jgi:hypothetical protein
MILRGLSFGEKLEALKYFNTNCSNWDRSFMDEPIQIRIFSALIEANRIQSEVLKAELEVLLLRKEIEQDVGAYNRVKDSCSPAQIDTHHWTISRKYCEIEKYLLDVRHHKKRLEDAEARHTELKSQLY